jgi:hypothetical protein
MQVSKLRNIAEEMLTVDLSRIRQMERIHITAVHHCC